MGRSVKGRATSNSWHSLCSWKGKQRACQTGSLGSIHRPKQSNPSDFQSLGLNRASPGCGPQPLLSNPFARRVSNEGDSVTKMTVCSDPGSSGMPGFSAIQFRSNRPVGNGPRRKTLAQNPDSPHDACVERRFLLLGPLHGRS